MFLIKILSGLVLIEFDKTNNALWGRLHLYL